MYNKDRDFAFAMTLGTVTDEWYANGAGAINYGFPVIADTYIREILPTGICTYEHVVRHPARPDREQGDRGPGPQGDGDRGAGAHGLRPGLRG